MGLAIRSLLAATVAASTLAAAPGATPAPAPAQPPPGTDGIARISPDLGAVLVDGSAADAAQAAYDDARARLDDRVAARDGAAAELATLADDEVRLTAEIAERTAARKAAALALVDARRRVQAAAVSSYVVETAADELTQVVDPDSSVAIGQVRTYADVVRTGHQTIADDAQQLLDEASRAVADAEGRRAEGRGRVAEVTSARDQAAADIDALAAEVTDRAGLWEQARATARVEGADFSLVALDAYWKAAASQPACGLGWWAVAGISRVEGRHGTFRGSRLAADGDVSPPILGIALDGTRGTRHIPDSDGGTLDGDLTYDRAVGPMQFIPTTWARWARDGDGDGDADPQNLYDATASAAAYLCRGRDLGTEEGLRAAYLSYNRSPEYVEEVLAEAYGYRTVQIPDPPQPAVLPS